MAISFQYDFLIVLGTTVLIGVILQKLVFIDQRYSSWLDKLFPFALAYFPTAIIYAFLANELPLRCFSFDPVLDAPNSNDLGPQSVSGDGLIAAIVYIATVVLNFTVWFFSLFIIIRHFSRRKKLTKSTSFQSNDISSFLD